MIHPCGKPRLSAINHLDWLGRQTHEIRFSSNILTVILKENYQNKVDQDVTLQKT